MARLGFGLLFLIGLSAAGCGRDGGHSGGVSARDQKHMDEILAQKIPEPKKIVVPPVTLPPGTRFTREDIPNEGGYLQIPIVEITDDQANRFLCRMKTEPCTCGCPHTIDQCLITDPACTTAHSMAMQIMRDVTTGSN